jgi:hypothetical protein
MTTGASKSLNPAGFGKMSAGTFSATNFMVLPSV